ncbi:hypothetical protein D3C71_745190 [compost metagenome]
MKKLIFTFVVLAAVFGSKAQTYDWSSDMPADPYISYGNEIKSLMYSGKLYHFTDSNSNYLRVTVYDPKQETWKRVGTETTYVGSISKIQAEVVNNKAFIVTGGTSGLFMHELDFSTNQLTVHNSLIGSGGLSGNWEFKAHSGSGTLIVMYSENSTLQLCTFNTGTSSWNSSSFVGTQLDPTSNSYAAKYIISFSSTSIYYGVSGTSNNRLAIAPLATPYGITYYNSTGANDGRLKNNSGTNFVSGNFFLAGNGQNEPKVYMRNYANQTTYEKDFSGSANITLNTTTDPSLLFNIDTNNFEVTQNAAYSFLLSNYAPAGNGTFGSLFVFRKDWNTGDWDTLGIQVPPTAGLNNILMLSLDASGEHLVINYQNDGYYYSDVFNTKPEINPASIVANTGTCKNSNNQLFHALEFYDDNRDGPLKIHSITDVNGIVSNLTAQIIYFDNSSSPAITKYAIYGSIGATGGNAAISIDLSDGYSVTNIDLPVVSVGNIVAPTVNFTSNPLNLCSNDNLINLSNFVNYYDNGIFKINGSVVNGTTIDGTVVSQTFTGGTITMQDEIDGCIVNATASLSFPFLGSASVVSTASACGSTTGTATVTFTPGASATYTLEWSTGETTNSISNLAPGPYYYNVTDEYNCHITGTTSVEATGVTLTPTITNVSCHGLNDGSISINIVNPNAYQFLWSNGYGSSTISNLAPGSYSINVWDDNGCQVSGSYTITQPAAILASLSGTEPTCGATNGSVLAIVSATGTPTYNWIGTGQTTSNLTGVGHGLYTLQVTDGNSCVREFTYQLDDKFAVDINGTITDAACNQQNGIIVIDFVQDPNGGTLANSWSWSNSATTQSNFNLNDGSYTITALSGSISQPCYSEKTFVVGTKAPLTQPICLVTVDTLTTTNLVVWERTETSGIHHYNIYRESDLAGNYQLIDTVMADNLSAFNDVVASPMDRSWRYKLSAVNDCGTESPISSEHKTLHLNTILVTGNGSIDVLWDDYEGSGNVSGYVVWRKTDQVDWIAVSPTIPLGTSFYNDAPTTGSTGIDYYIEMQLNSPCTAEKAQDFNTTRSNRERGQFSAGDGVEGTSSNSISENYLNEISMYPNPTQGVVIFEQSSNQSITYRITSLSGQVVRILSSSETKTEIQLHDLQSGIYLVEISSGDSKIIRRISKY